MKNILAAIDNSSYLDSICKLAIFFANKTGAKISLFHTGTINSNSNSSQDLSGTIGFDAQDNLLHELSEIDEKKSRQEQKKGWVVLKEAENIIQDYKKLDYEKIHKKGALVENIKDLQTDFDLLILGKRGVDHEESDEDLGFNIAKIIKQVNKPTLIASQNSVINYRGVKSFLLCYDGSKPAEKILNVVCKTSLLKSMQCHLLTIGENNEKNKSELEKARLKLESCGFGVKSLVAEAKQQEVQEVVKKYIQKNSINILAMGAFGHSAVRDFFLGSTTKALIKEVEIPILIMH